VRRNACPNGASSEVAHAAGEVHRSRSKPQTNTMSATGTAHVLRRRLEVAPGSSARRSGPHSLERTGPHLQALMGEGQQRLQRRTASCQLRRRRRRCLQRLHCRPAANTARPTSRTSPGHTPGFRARRAYTCMQVADRWCAEPHMPYIPIVSYSSRAPRRASTLTAAVASGVDTKVPAHPPAKRYSTLCGGRLSLPTS
jgi:hypothetical protein